MAKKLVYAGKGTPPQEESHLVNDENGNFVGAVKVTEDEASDFETLEDMGVADLPE